MNIRLRSLLPSLLCLLPLAAQAAPIPLYTVYQLDQTEPNCRKQCARVHVEYPQLLKAGNAAALNLIQQNLQKELAGALAMEKSMTNLNAAISAFFADSHSTHREAPDSPPWSLDQTTSVEYVANRLVSLRIFSAIYSGGAHGISLTAFANYDLQTGRPLRYVDLLKPNTQTALLKLAEERFRDDKQIPAGKSLSQGGFDFDKDRFSLPATVGIGRTGLTFYYNVYEINSFAYGPTELFIDYDSLDDLLKPEWQKLLLS